MHYGLAADIDRLHAWRMPTISEMFDHAFAKRRPPFRLTQDELFAAKGLPFDCPPVTERMVVRQHCKQALVPKRSYVAICSASRVGYKCHIEAPLSNERNLFRRRPLHKPNSHVGMLRGIAPY